MLRNPSATRRQCSQLCRHCSDDWRRRTDLYRFNRTDLQCGPQCHVEAEHHDYEQTGRKSSGAGLGGCGSSQPPPCHESRENKRQGKRRPPYRLIAEEFVIATMDTPSQHVEQPEYAASWNRDESEIDSPSSK